MSAGHRVRGLDQVERPASLAVHDYVQVDLCDRLAALSALRGMDAVVHLAGVPAEAPLQTVLDHNVTATFNVLDAARIHGIGRVVLASSNHVTGYYSTSEQVGPNSPLRPDTLYGFSKAAAEMLGRLFVEKCGLSVVAVRIGSFEVRPTEPRHLATWLAHDDAVRLFEAAVTAPDVRYLVLYGSSANRRAWWTHEGWDAIGYRPLHCADDEGSDLYAEEQGSGGESLQGGELPGFSLGNHGPTQRSS